MRLIDTTTDQAVSTGCVLVSSDRQAWRYESLITTSKGVRVHASRPSRTGRVHRHFAAEIFGCRVELDITWRQHVRHTITSARRRVDEWFMAGVLALPSLAVFEHYHLGEHLFAYLGMH